MERLSGHNESSILISAKDFECKAEPTVQQVEGLQPPPENPEGVPPDAGPESTGHVQLKRESFFLTD